MYSKDNPSSTPAKDERISSVIPDDLRETIEQHIPIYDGVTPPNIEGTYFISPQILVASSLEYDQIGNTYATEYDRFYDQDMTKNTISMVRVQGGGIEWAKGDGAFISGYDDKFTVYFDVEGANGTATFKSAQIISGTLTSVGIADVYTGFLLKEKNDPNNQIVAVGTFRFFSDSDKTSEKTDWPYAWPYNGPSAEARGVKDTLPGQHQR
ncbi:MAG: hypothetical protein IJ159_01190 [Prevotella sp.]|nr:hypothetical protein [Prevotella sp.]